MALRTDPYGNVYCPDCNGTLDSYWSVGDFVTTMFAGEVFTWILAAIFAGLGLVWTPAYLIAGCIVAVGLFKQASKQQRFTCLRCKREFTHKQLYGNDAI